jgi:hypothetical protein
MIKPNLTRDVYDKAWALLIGVNAYVDAALPGLTMLNMTVLDSTESEGKDMEAPL